MDLVTKVILAALTKLSEGIIKDAYDKLKAAIAQKYGEKSDLVDAVRNVEKKPDSPGRKETLKEEVAAARANEDPEILNLAQNLLNQLNRLGIQLDHPTVVQSAGRDAIQIVGPVEGDIIARITAGIDKQELNQAQSDFYNDRGREKIRQWGSGMVRGEWDWHALGQAIEYYVDSIKHNHQNQHAWTNLGYVYHLIGQARKAVDCLQRALELATPGPNYPGGHYKRVKSAVDRKAYLSGGRVSPPAMPEWFRTKYARYLD